MWTTSLVGFFISWLQMMKHNKNSYSALLLMYLLKYFSAATLQFFVFIGFLKSFGIFFVAFLQKYDATSAEVSIVISIQTFASTLTCKHLFQGFKF